MRAALLLTPGKPEGAALLLHMWEAKKTQLKREQSLLWYFFHRRQELLAEERKAEEAKEAAEGEANE